jgi:hypothetical protein
MLRKTLFAALLLFPLTAAALRADAGTAALLDLAWPHVPAARISELGHGVGVVFSPDLSVPGNCNFYQALGFACFQDSDWTRVLDIIRTQNILHPENVIRTLVLETHGTNGNGLKLQASYEPKAERSYVSVGALQERLEPDGVRFIIISACNSGRLMRPTIYRTLDPHPGDRLFLPATCGIVDASADFEPGRSRITVASPASSHIETTLVGKLRELAPATRRVLATAAKARGVRLAPEFAVSDVMMQMILRDDRLALVTGSYVDQLSGVVQPDAVSEGLFTSFVRLLNARAAVEAKPLPQPARPKKVVPRRRK